MKKIYSAILFIIITSNVCMAQENVMPSDPAGQEFISKQVKSLDQILNLTEEQEELLIPLLSKKYLIKEAYRKTTNESEKKELLLKLEAVNVEIESNFTEEQLLKLEENKRNIKLRHLNHKRSK